MLISFSFRCTRRAWDNYLEHCSTPPWPKSLLFKLKCWQATIQDIGKSTFMSKPGGIFLLWARFSNWFPDVSLITPTAIAVKAVIVTSEQRSHWYYSLISDNDNFVTRFHVSSFWFRKDCRTNLSLARSGNGWIIRRKTYWLSVLNKFQLH